MRLLLSVALAYGSIYDHSPPPARYRAADVVVTVRLTSESEVSRICGKGLKPPPAGEYYEACTLGDGQIVMPNPCHYLAQDYGLTLCHEVGHKLNWPKDHPK